jgi:hypothetical protein
MTWRIRIGCLNHKAVTVACAARQSSARRSARSSAITISTWFREMKWRVRFCRCRRRKVARLVTHGVLKLSTVERFNLDWLVRDRGSAVFATPRNRRELGPFTAETVENSRTSRNLHLECRARAGRAGAPARVEPRAKARARLGRARRVPHVREVEPRQSAPKKRDDDAAASEDGAVFSATKSPAG